MSFKEDHIASSFDHELSVLDRILNQMGVLAEGQLNTALKSLENRDSSLAYAVLASDINVDQLKAQTEAQALRILALRSPVADDLRRVISAIKVSGEIERIADIAANCAKRFTVLNQTSVHPPLHGLLHLGHTVQSRLSECLLSYRDENVEMAAKVRQSDVDVDTLYSGLFREILTYMMEDPRTITAGSHLLFIAKNLERIGDHATNIAEETIFLVTGSPLRDERPKADTTTSE
jgi:phosphate transport system protein